MKVYVVTQAEIDALETKMRLAVSEIRSERNFDAMVDDLWRRFNFELQNWLAEIKK